MQTAKKLAEAGYGVDGAVVNGFVQDGKITLNIDSPRYLNSVVGHEVTHILKGTKFYDALQEPITEYAKTKGEYQTRLDNLTKLYEGKPGYESDFDSKVQEELTADLVGDYLFTDSDFVKHLAAKNRNVFQKIYAEIKYLCKVATAGSKEARQLETARKNFEKAWDSVKNTTTKTGTAKTSYSLSNAEFSENNVDLYTEEQYNSYGWIRANDVMSAADYNQFNSYFADHKIHKHHYVQTKYGDSIIPVGKNLDVLVYANGDIDSPNISKVIKINENDEYSISQIRGDILENEKQGDKEPLRYVQIVYGEESVTIHKRQDLPSFRRFRGQREGNAGTKISSDNRTEQNGRGNAGTNNEIAPIKTSSDGDVFFDAKKQYSLSSDTDGNQLTKEQNEYFKDSKARDNDGNLQLVYHGTRNADFTVFKRNVNYFTDSKEMADSYSPNGEMYEGYVNITKPYEIDAEGEKWSKIPIDEVTRQFLQENGAGVFKEGGKWRTTPADIAAAIEEVVDNGDMDYDGVIIRNIDDTGSYYKGESKHLANDYIVFNSNQFKNADNVSPTSDPDIRFSLSKPVEETKDLIAVHNLHGNELMKTLELGGLPMPSVAIVKAADGHTDYFNEFKHSQYMNG